MTAECEHQWFAWARGRKTPALQSIYCGDCRVLLSAYIAALRAENERLRAHLVEDHQCRHDIDGTDQASAIPCSSA